MTTTSPLFLEWVAAERRRRPDWKTQRILKFLEQESPAISHVGGHDQTFKVACALVQGFDLEADEALHFLHGYNLKCFPHWETAELMHKVSDATRRPPAIRPYLLYPDRTGFSEGTDHQLQALADLRGFSVETIDWMSRDGFLVFGNWHGQETYGFTDSTGMVLELRRLDGLPFPAFKALEARKSHAVKNSRKDWPLGLLEAEPFPRIALVEGGPDWICVYQHILEQGKDDWAAVSMLSAMPNIGADALPHFAGKHVRFFPHNDAAGSKAVARWAQSLAGVAAHLDVLSLQDHEVAGVNDLCDYHHLVLANTVGGGLLHV